MIFLNNNCMSNELIKEGDVVGITSSLLPRFLGRVGIVTRINSYNSTLRYLISEIDETLYFDKEELIKIDLSQIRI